MARSARQSKILELISTKEIETQDGLSLVLLDNGEVYGWGYNTYGILGDGYEVGGIYPTPVKLKLENVRIYTSMENLFTLSKYSGYSPDLGESGSVDIGVGYNVFSRGVDQGRYPLPRTISFGIQVSL